MPTPSAVEKFMPETFRPTKTAQEMATRGEDVTAYFTNDFTVVRPEELDSTAAASKP